MKAGAKSDEADKTDKINLVNVPSVPWFSPPGFPLTGSKRGSALRTTPAALNATSFTTLSMRKNEMPQTNANCA
jgi:hypothetical protein